MHCVRKCIANGKRPRERTKRIWQKHVSVACVSFDPASRCLVSIVFFSSAYFWNASNDSSDRYDNELHSKWNGFFFLPWNVFFFIVSSVILFGKPVFHSNSENSCIHSSILWQEKKTSPFQISTQSLKRTGKKPSSFFLAHFPRHILSSSSKIVYTISIRQFSCYIWGQKTGKKVYSVMKNPSSKWGKRKKTSFVSKKKVWKRELARDRIWNFERYDADDAALCNLNEP